MTFGLSIIFLSCQSETSTPKTSDTPPVTDTAIETPAEVVPPDIEDSDIGEGELYPEEEPTFRHKKRMRIEHIKNSMVRISNGVEWTVNAVNKWDDYSETLGVPDFQYRVREDRSVSVMFQKFLDDAAVHTCSLWIAQDTIEGERTFFTEIEPDELDHAKTRLNLVALRRRIHGQVSEVDSPIIDSLSDLHYSVVQRTENIETAWLSVCVGLFTHPDFFMY